MLFINHTLQFECQPCHLKVNYLTPPIGSELTMQCNWVTMNQFGESLLNGFLL
jgi:hypothetical protein